MTKNEGWQPSNHNHKRINWLNSSIGWLYSWVGTRFNTYGGEKKDEWACGYDGIWMNGKDNYSSQPLRDVNYFHVDVQKKSHHELNGVLEKNDYLIQKW